MAKLIEYTPAYFPFLQSWVTDPDLLFQFAGTDFRFPLTIDQVIHYQERNADRSLYIYFNDLEEPVAFGEIIPQQNQIPRLARLLVGNSDSRGKGLGVSFIKLLVEECKRLYDPPSVELYVLTDNIQAIKCYKKCGFDFISDQPKTLVHEGNEFLILKMALNLRND